jgi:hypothetical protein
MRIPKGIVRGLLPGLLSLAAVGPLTGQPLSTPPADKSRGPAARPGEVKGVARVSVHPYKMEKGNTYRITVKGEGFFPQVRIQGQPVNPFGGPAGSPFGGQSGSPFGTFPAGPAPAAGRRTSQMLFTPKVTKEYAITVDAAPGTELGEGPLPYTLTVERAVFRPHVALNDPQLELNEQTKKLEAGKAYSISVTGKGFAPEVQVLDGGRPVATAFNGRWFGFGPDAEFVTNLVFRPARTADYRLLVAVGPLAEQRQTPLTYTTRLVELKVTLSINEQLTRQDPAYPRRGGPHKVHAVKLEAGKSYQIDLVSRAFDAYLFLEDATGKVLAVDDDSGGQLNARILFRPDRTDTYRVVATTFNRAGPAGPAGPYTLTVVENPDAQPRFGSLVPHSGAVPDSPKN